MILEEWKKLVEIRQNFADEETKIEKQVFAIKLPSKGEHDYLISEWNAIKKLRKMAATQVAEGWFTLTDKQREEINSKYNKGHMKK